jgi:endonuclease/exonuclease/phosphatase family metal-dependent hydrolase
VVLARVEVGRTLVWVGSTHLPASQEADRARALHRLAELLKQLGTLWLVCGDFNTRISTWRDDLPDGVTVTPRWRRATFPARHPMRAIDYGLASPGLRTRGRVLASSGSDHRAIFVTAALGASLPARPPRV